MSDAKYLILGLTPGLLQATVFETHQFLDVAMERIEIMRTNNPSSTFTLVAVLE